MPTDYETLAKQFGGVVGQKKEGSNVDYSSLAQKFGGNVAAQPTKNAAPPDMSRANQPFSAEDEKKFYGKQPNQVDYAALAQKYGVQDVKTPQEKIPQQASMETWNPADNEAAVKARGNDDWMTPEQRIRYRSTQEGLSKDRTEERLGRYRSGVEGHNLTPQRAEEYAYAKQWQDQTKENLPPEEKNRVYKYALQQAQAYKSGQQPTLETHWLGSSTSPLGEDTEYYRQHIDPEEYARNYADGYAWARGQGWDEERSQRFGASDVAARMEMRASAVGGHWMEDIKSGVSWAANKLGIPDPDKMLSSPLSYVAEGSGIEGGDLDLVKAKNNSWADKVAEKSKWKGAIAKGQSSLANLSIQLGEIFTDPQNVALIVASRGESLPEQLGLETPIAATRVIRTTSELANWGFRYQMAEGSIGTEGRAIEAAKKGDVSEFIEYALSGIVQGAMAAHGIGEEKARAEVKRHIDLASQGAFSKDFSQLKTPQEQAVVLDKVWNNDPYFQRSQNLVGKEAERNIKRVQYRQSEALRQAWHPNAAFRAVRKIAADREELAAKEYDTAVQNSIREAAEKNAKAAAVANEKIAADNGAAKERNERVRSERENQSPRPQATETVPATIVDGEKVYGPVTVLEEPAHIGVDDIGNRVYRIGEDGSKQWLNSTGFFGSEESAVMLPDTETADTLARIQALKTTVTADADKDAHLGNVTSQLIDKEIDYRHAQDVTGIGGDERIPDEHDAAHGKGVEGPFVKGRAEFLSDFDKGYEKTGWPEEKKSATLAQAEASAWELTNENLNMITRSGDQIIDREGKPWTLGGDGLLHGADGREIPLTKDGLYTNQVMNMAAHGRVRYGRQSYEESIKPPTYFGSKLASAIEHPIENRTPTAATVEPSVERVAEEVKKSAESSKAKDVEGAVYEYAASKNMDPHSLVEDIEKKLVERRTAEERQFLVNYENWKNWQEYKGEPVYEPINIQNDQLAAQEIRDRAGYPPPEPRNEEEAKGNVYATEGRQEVAISEVARTTAEAFDVNAGTKEQDTEKRLQAEKEATDTLYLAVQQSADAAGKAAPKGNYPRGGGILVVSRGDRTEVNKGKESHPAQYALMDVESPIVSHTWNGNSLEDNEEYVPKEMQYRDFDENRTAELLGESQPENYKYRLYFDSGYGPDNGPAILDSYGRVIGGNTRLLRLKKWLENMSRMGDTKARDAEMIVFNDAVAKFSAKVGIKHVPDDGRTYIPVRVLDKPIETVGEAARLGRLFNDRSLAQVSENIEALSNGKILSESDARERLDGKPGILSDIGERISAKGVSTVRAAIDADPYWFAKVAKDYFHISTTDNAAWFDSVGEDATLSNAGKDKFVLALIGSHIADTRSVRALRGTDAESSLTRAIGTVTALRAHPKHDLTERVTEAVAAAAKTLRLRRDGEKPIPAWNHVYANNDLYLGKPNEPSRVSQAIYLALLDPKTSRLNVALKDMIAGEPGMEMLFAPKVEGKELHTAADYFNVAFKPELEKIAKSQEKTFDPVTVAEFEAALQNREWIPQEEKKPEAKVEEQPKVKPEEKVEEVPKFGKPPETSKKTGFPEPPKTRSDKEIARDGLLNQVRDQGYVDRNGLKTFLETDPVTRENANWTMKNFQWVAKAIWEHEKPEGVEGKDALDWLLERKKILGSVERDNYHERGRGRTEWDEVGRAHVYLHRDADATTAIHELWHAFLPLLSEEDLRSLNTIKGKKKAIWDGKSRSDLVGEAFDEFSERAISGIEKYYRDEEPKDFSAETGKVLAKLKAMFQQVYKKWKEDPLRPFRLTEKAKESLDKIFHVEGVERVTGLDRADEFQTETEAAEKSKKRLKKPSEVLDPIQEMGKEIGASGKPEKFVSGPIEYGTGKPIKVEKSVAYSFDKVDEAMRAVRILEDEIDQGSKRIDAADVVKTRDGKYAVRVNFISSPKRGIAYQELPPESRGEMGVRLKQLKRELGALPRTKILDKQFLQMRIDDLENRIEAAFGNEERAPKSDPELAHKVMEERKDERANRAGKGVHEATGIQKPPTVDRVSGKAELGVSRHAGAGGSASIRGLGLDRVGAISMPPLRETDDPVVGKTADDAPETEESWKKRTGDAGMSTESPLPTWALSPRTARILDEDKHPGQAPTVQIVMSALQRGDGALVANGTGSGKTFVAMGIVSEFGRDREAGDKPLTLYITRNRPLLEKTADEPAKSFGIELSVDTPKFGETNGAYGVSYQAALRNPVYQNIKWDLVIADEAGEARNWFKKSENKKGMSQGQMLMAIMQNAKKGVYMSATPFHTPLEVGYLEKLGLWPKDGYEDWLKHNFKTYYKDKTLVAELDPAKMAKLRKQLIQRGQMTSQTLSYEGFNAHFAFVPMTNAMKRGLDTISGLMERARTRTKLTEGLSPKSISAYEAQFTKAFVEREMLPQVIDIAKTGLEQGYSVIIASPSTDEDLFRRERDGDPTPFQQMDDSMNGQFSRLMPRLPNVFEALQGEFGDRIGNYSGVNQSETGREKVRKEFQDGTRDLAYMSIPAGGIGSDWNDKKGDKPRLMLVMGPPYSGVLLEQTLGRPWRDGTKSDVHVIFLGTDAAPQVRIMKELVAPRMRSLRAAVHGIKDSLATAMENYSDMEKTRAEQDTMTFAMGNEIEVKAADFGVRHSGRVVGIDSWDAIEIPPASEAMNKGLRTGEKAGRDWTDLYQDKEKAFYPPPKNVKAEKAINDIAESAAKNPDISEDTIALGAAHAAEVADMSPEGIDPAEAGKYAMKASLESNGFTYNQETGEWEAPFGVVEKMLGGDTSGIDERGPDYSAKPGIADKIKGKIRVPAINLARKIGLQKEVRGWFDEKSGLYSKATVGMNFEQRALSAARRIGAEPQVRRVFGLNYLYDQAKEKYAGPSQMKLLEIFTKNGLNPNPKSLVEKTGLFGKPGRDDVRTVIDVVEGRAASDDIRINKAAEELRQWFADWHTSFVAKGVHLDDGGTFADIPKNPKYVNHITDWDMELTDPQTGEIRSLAEITDDKTLDDVAKLRYFEKTRQELKVGSETARGWLNQLNEDRKAHLKRPKNPNITRKRTINHPFYHKDIWSLMSYSDQAASALSLEETYGHDMSRLGSALADVPSKDLRKALKKDADLAFERQDWSTTVGKIVRSGQGFEAIMKMALSPLSVAMHNIHAATNVGMKPWFTAQMRMLRHPRERMREKYYAGVVMIKMNPTLLEGPRRGVAGKYFDWSGFSAVYRWQRASVAETAWAWMEQDALSDLRAGGKRAETSRRLLKDRMLLSDDEINKAVANNRWDDESKWKAERVFADKVAFSERSSQMPRMARLSMAEDLDDSEKNAHAALRGAYMLQSFQTKTYSGLKEWLFDEVFHHRNYRPLLPFFLLYPAAGFVLMNLKGVVKGGIHRTFEKATGQEHEHDSWDDLLDEYRDLEKHPWSGALKLYLDCMLLGQANERVKRWVDIGMMAEMGQKKKLENRLQYFAVDELDQLVGGLYSDIFMAGVVTPAKALDDYLRTKNPMKKAKAAVKVIAKEAKNLAWPLGTIPWVNKLAGTKKFQPPPK